MVAASRYSLARSRNPSGGAGSSIRLDQQTVLGKRVDVAAERSVDERDEHVLFDLLIALLLDEVRADPPVLLGRIEHVIVDPSAVRSLQQRMVEEEAEPAAGLQHAGDFADRFVDVADVLEHETRNHCVEASSANGSVAASPRANDAPPRWAATLTQFHVGSMPDDVGAEAAMPTD